MNKVFLIGRLTKSPELKTTMNGSSICSFTLAVPRKYASKGEERKTDFINCTAWRGTAEFISKYFDKGQMMAVEGRIETRSWEDNDGIRRYATDVIVEDVEFVGGKKEQEPKKKVELPVIDLPDLPDFMR